MSNASRELSKRQRRAEAIKKADQHRMRKQRAKNAPRPAAAKRRARGKK